MSYAGNWVLGPYIQAVFLYLLENRYKKHVYMEKADEGFSHLSFFG
jgi:hypothetical protein